MSFPEFDATKKKILFFSRGRGRGHAAPDLEIIHALESLRADVEVRVASYATGAATFAEFGRPLIDLGLPEDGSIPEMSTLAGKLIGWLNPDLVVSHEEFAAMPAAKIFDKPTLFLTDWFADPDTYVMGALKFADRIVFLGSRGIFEEPTWVVEKTHYVGAILRNFRYAPADRLRAREELGIAKESFALSVFPGSWREYDAPILDTVAGAFDALCFAPKKLIWLAGLDLEAVQVRLAGRSDVAAFARDWQIDRLMVASDAAITKTNRKTVYELQRLRVPTIAISFALNPMDDRAVGALASVVLLDGRSLDSATLVKEIERLRAAPPEPSEIAYCGVEQCARLISDQLDRATRLKPSPESG